MQAGFSLLTAHGTKSDTTNKRANPIKTIPEALSPLARVYLASLHQTAPWLRRNNLYIFSLTKEKHCPMTAAAVQGHQVPSCERKHSGNLRLCRPWNIIFLVPRAAGRSSTAHVKTLWECWALPFPQLPEEAQEEFYF